MRFSARKSEQTSITPILLYTLLHQSLVCRDHSASSPRQHVVAGHISQDAQTGSFVQLCRLLYHRFQGLCDNICCCSCCYIYSCSCCCYTRCCFLRSQDMDAVLCQNRALGQEARYNYALGRQGQGNACHRAPTRRSPSRRPLGSSDS